MPAYEKLGPLIPNLGVTGSNPVGVTHLADRRAGKGRADHDHGSGHRLPGSCRRALLELAVNGHASLIISGDADLLTLNPFRTIPIITPAIFVKTGSS